MNKDNLLKLADYLETVDGSRFDMLRCHTSGLEAYQVTDENYGCGTAACALGYGPAAGIPALPNEDWLAYSYRVFLGAGEEDLWNWLFSAAWAGTDNTPKGAVKRIRQSINDELPEDWDRLSVYFGGIGDEQG